MGQKICARDKPSTLTTFHGVIHELLTSILHAQTRCRSVRVDLPLDKKTLENQDWASGPSQAAGRWAVAGRGPCAMGRWAVAGRGPAFSKTLFCPAVNPRACTGLHHVWAYKMDEGEFEFIYHYNIK